MPLWVNMAVFCEAVAGIGANERWPVKMFTVKQGSLPDIGPNQITVFPLDVHLFVSLAVEDFLEEFSVETSFHGLDGSLLGEQSHLFRVPAGHPVAQLDWRIRGKLPALGTYWAEVRFGQDILTRVPLTLANEK